MLFLSTILLLLHFSFIPAVFNWLRELAGWRGAWVLAGGWRRFVYVAFVLIFYRDKPEDSGLLPDGITPEELEQELKEATADDIEEDWEYSEVLRNYTFWIFNISLAMYSLVITAVTFHISSIFEVAGRGNDEAFGMFKYAAAIGVVINLTVGFLSDMKFFKHRLHWMLLVLVASLVLELVGVALFDSLQCVSLIIIGQGVSSGVFGAALQPGLATVLRQEASGADQRVGDGVYGLLQCGWSEYLRLELRVLWRICQLFIHSDGDSDYSGAGVNQSKVPASEAWLRVV